MKGGKAMSYNVNYGYANPGYQGANMKEFCNPNSKMTLTGRGTIKVKPDIAIINLGVETKGNNLQDTQAENALISNQLINTILKEGVRENDIQTYSYIINPEYEYVNGKQIFKGYRVINNYRVTIREIDKVGNIIDAAVKSGANLAQNIEFSVSNGSIYYNQALNLAIEDAIKKAENIERRFNYKINKIPESIKEESYGQPIVMESTTLKAMPGTPVKSGLMEISAAVTAVFCYR